MRLIDVDTLEWFRITLSNGETCILIRKPHINELPTADAEPVRHGEWVHVEDDEYLCSACKMEFTIEDFDSFVTNYCPNCGAKMDGKENE